MTEIRDRGSEIKWATILISGLGSLMFVSAALPAQQATRALTVTKELVLDATKEDFNQIGTVVPRKNGDVLIVVEQGTIRYYSADGKKLGTFGRIGQGPGEFRGMLIGTKHDTVWIGHGQNTRLTWMGEDRKALRMQRLPAGIQVDPKAPGLLAGLGVPVPSAIYPNGDMLYRVFRVLKTATAPWLSESGTAVVRTTSTGVFKSRIAVIPLETPPGMSVNRQTATGSWGRMLPMYPVQYSAIARDGSRIVMLAQDNRDPVRANVTSSYRVVMVGERGDTIYKKSISYQPEALRAGLMDSLLSDPTAPPEFRGEARTMNLPKSYAPVRWLTLADDGSLWISLRVAANADAKFLALDPKGAVRGTLSLPAGAFISAAAANKIFVWTPDADDLPSLTRYHVGGSGTAGN